MCSREWGWRTRFFPLLFKKNCHRNQIRLKIYLHIGCQRWGEYFKMLSGLNFMFLFHINTHTLLCLPLKKKKAGWLIKNRTLFFAVHEAGKSKIKVTVDATSRGALLHSSSMVSLHCVLTCQRGEGDVWGLFYKDINSVHEGSSFMI